ncbi:MAG: CDP-alcohol phosphatidyltransferase family protein [Armatimonadota bacterium]|nr:CDP-alcohol phosphatidyltransferase family protein [Armatimonadota bacterium]MDR7533776.1 CDP-alcohol phosphatidyltransferase family protein [Armatimonadota bacterium]MDR7535766.1 CDP-alcohol phosphatidyltransferase family protein [Armatimonadota bacterium]
MPSTRAAAADARQSVEAVPAPPRTAWSVGYWLWLAYRVSAVCVPACARLGVHPNQVTAVAFLAGLTGTALLASGTAAGALGGALLVNLYYLLDALDGDLARATHRTSVYGSYLDDLNGHLMPALLFVALGVHVYRAVEAPLWAVGPDDGRTAFLILGGAGALAAAQRALGEMRMREGVRKLVRRGPPARLLTASPTPFAGALGQSEAFLRHVVGSHLIGMDGSFLPALVVAALWRRVDLLLIVTAPLSLLSLLWYLARTTVALQRADRREDP